MNIINYNNYDLDSDKLFNYLISKNIIFNNIYIFVLCYDYIEIMSLIFLNDIKNFLSNKKKNNSIIIYNTIIDDSCNKYNNLYLNIINLIKSKYNVLLINTSVIHFN